MTNDELIQEAFATLDQKPDAVIPGWPDGGTLYHIHGEAGLGAIGAGPGVGIIFAYMISTRLKPQFWQVEPTPEAVVEAIKKIGELLWLVKMDKWEEERGPLFPNGSGGGVVAAHRRKQREGG